MARIAVAGLGYVGLTTAACLADLGHDVTGVDIDRERVDLLGDGGMPIYEPGLGELVARNLTAGRLGFTAEYTEAMAGADFAFIAVATPEGDDGHADLAAVEGAAAAIAGAAQGPLVIVNKSTVPIGTGDLVGSVARRHTSYAMAVVSNPEFLREGSALTDFMQPDRVVIGAHDREAAERVAALYATLAAPVVITDVYTAELIKYASNAFLATRISFINEIARIAERVGADIKVVAEGMGMDRRIGPHFLDAGIGYGGSCFPKDVKALAAIAEQYGHHPELLNAVMDINRDQRRMVVERLREGLGTLPGKRVGLLGLAFKPNTDDLREAPSLEIARHLVREHAEVAAYDPAAMDGARRILPAVDYRESAYEVADQADALVLVTEWNEFRQLDFERLKSLMRGDLLIDGRNVYDPAQLQTLGFRYRGVGRR